MAPWRKKGANKKKADIGLVLGDLVLAKVKGYPYWPAKISRPEDWEQAPDQKKIFVQFFGTQEMLVPALSTAFVAPSDIQAFTNETKSKLCSRSQGKSKFFAKAASEICAAFEEFHNKHPTALRNDNEESAPCKALAADRIDDDGVEVELKDGTGQGEPKGSNDIQLGETEREETKPTASCPNYRASPTITLENNTDAFDDAQGKEALFLSSRDNSSDVEGDVTADVTYDKVLQQTDSRLRSVAANGNKSNRMASSFNRESEGGQKSNSSREASFEANNPKVRSEAPDSSEQFNNISGIQKVRDLRKVRKSSNVFVDPHKNIAGLKDMPSKKEKKAQSAGRTTMLGEDEVLHPTKRSKWTDRDAPPTKHSPKSGAATSLEPNNSFSHSNSNKIMVTQPVKRRRALRIDEDDDGPKTPVHGALGGSFKSTPICETPGRPAGVVAPFVPKDSSLLFCNKVVSPGQQGVCLPGILCASLTSKMLEPRYSSAMEVKPDLVSSEEKQVLVSSKKSPHLVLDTKPVLEQNKTNKPCGPKAALVLSSKSSEVILDAVNISQSQKNVQNLSGERPGTKAKAISRIGERGGLTESSTCCHSSSEIVEVASEDNVNSLINLKTSYSETSMKSLIATAQEKRRQAYSQHISLVNPSSFVSLTDIQGSSTSAFHVRPFLSGSSTHGEVHESQTDFASPPTYDHHSSARIEPDNEEVEERIVSPEYRKAGGSLSVGTDAAMTRDTFEGMIKTLSRTKESIRKATRLAIDCAKHGIANEVVELLIQKLENEPSLHRKVDIFFLVDSITQSSHNQKGTPATSYIPIVQDALPRLLGAAVPSRPGARDNRRQCNKVLRLWIERKILPEVVLRRYIDDIGVSYDEPASGPLLKRTSRRAERAFDDPIREMEGMLVDEYGSNATYQFPGGFLSSQVFEDDDEDFPSIFKKKESDLSLDERPYALGESETCFVTPNHRRHSFFGKVNGELEMEDACGHLKNEGALFVTGAYEGSPRHHGPDRIVESASRDSNDFSLLSEGSPPLPLDSPPLSPPLPPSPPPPPPPPLPAQPHPLPSQLGFPPPPPPPPPPLGGPLVMLQSVPAQPALLNQPLLPTESLPQSSQQLVYHPPLPHDFFAPGGNQIVQRSGSTLNGMFPQQSPCFVPSRIPSARDFSGFNSFRQMEHGNNGMYIRNPQESQQNQPFQPSPAPFVQAHFPPSLRQVPSNHFSYPRHVNQQQRPHPYPLLYSMQSLSEGHMHRVPADKNKMAISSEFAADNSHGPWMNGMRNSIHSAPSCSNGGNFRPLPERANNISFQHANLNNFPAAARRPGHAGTQIFPPRYVVNGQRAA